MNINLGSKINVVIQSEKKHKHEEETKTAKKVPEVVVVVEIVVKTVFVERLGFCRAQTGGLDLVHEEVGSRQSKSNGETKEDKARPGLSLSSVELHAAVEDEVAEEVGHEDEEQESWEVRLKEKKNAQPHVDNKEYTDKDEPEQCI